MSLPHCRRRCCFSASSSAFCLAASSGERQAWRARKASTNGAVCMDTSLPSLSIILLGTYSPESLEFSSSLPKTESRPPPTLEDFSVCLFHTGRAPFGLDMALAVRGQPVGARSAAPWRAHTQYSLLISRLGATQSATEVPRRRLTFNLHVTPRRKRESREIIQRSAHVPPASTQVQPYPVRGSMPLHCALRCHFTPMCSTAAPHCSHSAHISTFSSRFEAVTSPSARRYIRSTIHQIPHAPRHYMHIHVTCTCTCNMDMRMYSAVTPWLSCSSLPTEAGLLKGREY